MKQWATDLVVPNSTPPWGRNLSNHLYKSANNQGSDQTVLMHLLVWAFAGRILVKHHVC